MRARLDGIKAARAAFARLPEVTRDAVNGVQEVTAHQIAQGAQARARRRTGRLAKAIGYSVDRRRGTAKVGITKESRVFHGHLVEFGTVHSRAFPFMLPAVEAERARHERRLAMAGQSIERNMARVGGQFL